MKTVTFIAQEELELLKVLLEDLKLQVVKAGLPYRNIKSTPEMNLMVAIAQWEWDERYGVLEENRSEVEIKNGKIRVGDLVLLEYFQKKFGFIE